MPPVLRHPFEGLICTVDFFLAFFGRCPSRHDGRHHHQILRRYERVCTTSAQLATVVFVRLHPGCNSLRRDSTHCPMATPAASAWHRRRHILSTPSTRINTVQESSLLSNRRTPDFPSSSAPPSQRRAPSSEVRWGQSRDQLSDSRWGQSESILAPRAPQRPQLSFIRMISQLLFSLRSHAHNSISKSVFVTLATIQGAFLFLYATDFVAYFISPCIHGCRHLTRLHRFPVILSMFRFASGIAFGLTLFAIHFLFCRVVVKQMRSWRRQFYSRSVLEGALLRLRLLHGLGCVSGCVLQSISMAYVLYGPALTPISLSWSKCAPQQLAMLNRQLIPEWSDLTPHALFGLFSGIIYTVIWTMTGAHATHSYPFHVKVLRRVWLYVPRVILMSGIPTILAAVPAVLLQYLLAETSHLAIPESGPWTKLVEWWGVVFAAVWCSFIALFSWNAISVLEEQFFGPGKSLTAEVGRARGHRDQGEFLASEGTKFLTLIEQCASSKSFDNDDEESIREMLVSLSFLTKPDADMSDFPAFLDASGEVWRITLHQCLSPIDFLQDLLREYNVRRFQKSSLRGSTALFRGPSRSGMPPNATSFFGGHKSFVFPDADLCIASCQIISTLFVVSYDLDTYGVVHRTLAQTVQSLLLCKEQTETFLAVRDAAGKDGRSGDYSFDKKGILRRLRDVMQLGSDYETIAAIDDAIKLAMYRIIGTFRTHMYNFVDGNEVTWDRSLDRQLREFLNYQTA